MSKPKIKFKDSTVNTLIIPENFTVKGYSLEAIYVEQDVANAPCFGGHTCNGAQFDIYINNIKVLEANLNNDGQGSPPPVMEDGIGSSDNDRYNITTITEEQANAIAKSSRFDFVIEIRPNPANTAPHENITWVRLKNPLGKIIYSTCISVGSSTEVTDAILLDANAIKSINFQEEVALPFSVSNLSVGGEYQIKYEVIDAQYLNTIKPNEKVFKFINPCCNSLIANETPNGYTLISQTPNINCSVVLQVQCVQSALVQTLLIKDGAVLSRDIVHINSTYCNIAVKNNDFAVAFDNLSILGTRLDSQINFGNTLEKPMIIESNQYVGNPITLLCSNLTLNRLYEYEFRYVPLSTSLDIEPEKGRFFAGNTERRVMSMLTLLNPQILIFYASLKDIETGIVKTTRPIYIYNGQNCAEMVRNFEFSEIDQIPPVCDLKNCEVIQ